MRILGGLLLFIVGGAITIYSEKLFVAFGRIYFAEKYLGTEGGSRLFYKLFGIIVSILGLMIATNMLGGILFGIFGSILPTPQP